MWVRYYLAVLSHFNFHFWSSSPFWPSSPIIRVYSLWNSFLIIDLYVELLWELSILRCMCTVNVRHATLCSRCALYNFTPIFRYAKSNSWYAHNINIQITNISHNSNTTPKSCNHFHKTISSTTLYFTYQTYCAITIRKDILFHVVGEVCTYLFTVLLIQLYSFTSQHNLSSD